MFEHARSGAVDIVRSSDPINLEHVQELAEVLDECLLRGQPRVVVDLERVALIDSAGLELLLDYQDRCIERGGVMKLSAPTPLCCDILSVTDVVARFEVHQDCLSAVGSFAQ
jgi:anti-sigma B factor antagonist